MPTKAAIKKQEAVKELMKKTKPVIATRCVGAEQLNDRLNATIDDLQELHEDASARARKSEQEKKNAIKSRNDTAKLLHKARNESETHRQEVDRLKEQLEAVHNQLTECQRDLAERKHLHLQSERDLEEALQSVKAEEAHHHLQKQRLKEATEFHIGFREEMNEELQSMKNLLNSTRLKLNDERHVHEQTKQELLMQQAMRANLHKLVEQLVHRD